MNIADDPLPLNADNHYKVPCDCPDNFTGESCEIDSRGCEIDPCPDFSECVPDVMAPGTYQCTCSQGYTIDDDGKCVGKFV